MTLPVIIFQHGLASNPLRAIHHAPQKGSYSASVDRSGRLQIIFTYFLSTYQTLLIGRSVILIVHGWKILTNGPPLVSYSPAKAQRAIKAFVF